MNMSIFYSRRSIVSIVIVTLFLAVCLLPAGELFAQSWKDTNNAVIKENNVKVRARSDMPETGVTPSLQPGQIINRKDLPEVILAPGVKCKMYWGKGVLVNWMTLDPGAEVPREKLPAERLMVVFKGSVDQLINGAFVPVKDYATVTNWSSTPGRQFVYMPKGAENAMKAGKDGAEVLEIYSPVRADYIKKAGGTVPDKEVLCPTKAVPTFPANQVLSYYDVQFTDLSMATSNSRLISGEYFQASFLSVDPGRVSPMHNHPEEQLMIVLRGAVTETVVDKTTVMQPGDIAYLPPDMVHKGEYGTLGCDIIDVFWPVRPDFLEKMNDRLAKFHAIIPKDAKVKIVHDGEINEPFLNFTEGPCWFDGRLFFSNMWFANDFSAGSPEKSNLIRINRDGSLTVLVKNMQTNGIMPLGNGHLAVCDMYGHRIFEMCPETGKDLGTLVSEYNGVPFDGPNDLVVDAKGGIYFSDPQFTPGLPKTQPGKSVFYRRPTGEVIRVVNPGEFGQPNGVLLSPDGKICYINNTRNMPIGNYVAALDVMSDGTLTNVRKLAKLFVMPAVRDKGDITTGADGMAIDEEGNLYFATHMGLQIFDKDGNFIGIVDLPIRPTSCKFGGDDYKTLYFACPTKIYSLKTNKKGLQYPLKPQK